MTDIPDISGYKLKDAGVILKKSGINEKIVITSPPRKIYKEYYEEFRILRIRKNSNGSAEILICR
jgi:hypothetical protein